MTAGQREHWQSVHATKSPEQTSWHRPHLDASLHLLEAHGADPTLPAIDVGGGRSTLADDLLLRGFADLTVLDVSGDALEQLAARLAASPDPALRDAAAQGALHLLERDVLDAELPAARFGLWHDRAVFHFLVDDSEQDVYAAMATRSLRSGGLLVIATFAPHGPTRCSGLPVQRYDADSLTARFGDGFVRIDALDEAHVTPTGATQHFTYVALRRLPTPDSLPRAAHAATG